MSLHCLTYVLRKNHETMNSRINGHHSTQLRPFQFKSGVTFQCHHIVFCGVNSQSAQLTARLAETMKYEFIYPSSLYLIFVDLHSYGYYGGDCGMFMCPYLQGVCYDCSMVTPQGKLLAYVFGGYVPWMLQIWTQLELTSVQLSLKLYPLEWVRNVCTSCTVLWYKDN